MKKKTDWTISEMMEWGKKYFSEKGIDSPRLTIEMMISTVADMTRLQIYTEHDKPLSQFEIERLREFIQRRVRREPLQYILQKTYFYGLEFSVSPSVLIPRPETEVLVEQAISSLKKKSHTQPFVLDIGTGSGAIALSVAHHVPNSTVIGIDVSSDALDVAQKNKESLDVENVTFAKANIFDAIARNSSRKESRKYDVILSNPPYISAKELLETDDEVQKFEPSIALTDEGNGYSFYHCFAQIFSNMLKAEGIFVVECGLGMAGNVASIFKKVGFSTRIFQDLEGVERFVIGELR